MAPSPPSPADLTSRWRRRPDVPWRATLRGVVVLPPTREEPITVTGSGRLVWELLEQPRALDELVRDVASRFPSVPPTLADEVAVLVAELSRQGVVEPVDP